MKKYVLTGCRTSEWRNARGKGIEVYEISENQHWRHCYTMSTPSDNPSWLTFDTKRQQLYVIYGDGDKVSQYSFERDSGRLSYLGSQTTGPRHNNTELQPERKNNPVCSCLTPDGASLLIANHEAGNIARLDFDQQNHLVAPQYFLTIPGKDSPDYQDISLSRPHQIVYDNTGKFMFLPIQGRKAGNGIDMVQVYVIENRNYKPVCTVEMTVGCWPRHICVHPDNRYIYCVNELGCSITVLQFDDNTGLLQKIREIRTLPENVAIKYDASEINLHRNGKFLYVSNRVHNSISLFYISENGQPEFIEWFKCGGKTPRFTTLSPDQRYFYSANEDSDNIVEFLVNSDNGYLEPTGKVIRNASPTCLLFI